MTINFDLNANSINRVIADLNKIKQDLKTVMIDDFLNLCCEWLKDRANYYLTISDIGENVKSAIREGWTYTVKQGKATLTNNAQKAVFVEFGVGAIGASIPHENAEEAGYEYNMNNRETWSFIVKDEADIDMHPGYMIREIEDTEDGNLMVTTRGSWRVMYAFQALLDARDDLKNPNGAFARMWYNVKARYIK